LRDKTLIFGVKFLEYVLFELKENLNNGYYTVIFFWAKLVRNGRIRAVEVRPQFGRISSIAQPKNLLNWGNFTQIEINSPEIFGAKLNCAGSPILGEKIITV
jgi:hypothetical protein